MKTYAAVPAHAFTKIRDRLWSLPTALVLLWAFVLIWGERVVFERRVNQCQWRQWETWVSGKHRELSTQSLAYTESRYSSTHKPNLTIFSWSPILN